MLSDWESLRRRLRGYLRTRGRDADVEDVVQDVLLKLHAHAPALPDERSRVAWALRVARNRAIDHHRKQRETAPLDAEPMAASAIGATTSAQLATCLPRMLRLLPHGYREAVELADLMGWPQHRVATELGVSTSGAKSRVQRGRKQLAAMLAQCCDVERDARGGIVDFQRTARAAEFCGAATDSEKSCVHSAAASSSLPTAAIVAAERRQTGDES